jgi:hypothetical protein
MDWPMRAASARRPGPGREARHRRGRRGGWREGQEARSNDTFTKAPQFPQPVTPLQQGRIVGRIMLRATSLVLDFYRFGARGAIRV